MTCKTDKTHVAYLITWTESECGWGFRPDGVSLHLSQEDVKTYLKEYWDNMPKEAPYEYSKNDSGTGKLVMVSDSMHKQLKISKCRSGIRLWQGDYNIARRNGDIKE